MSIGTNRTIYLRQEDAAMWNELKKYLHFYEDRSLSEFLLGAAREELRRLKMKHEKGRR